MRNIFFFKTVFIVVILILSVSGCTIDGFTKKEIKQIMLYKPNDALPLLTINEKSDSLFLRQKARKTDKNVISTIYIERLKSKMLATVIDSLNPGVGIAAPQVGIGIQMIYVQRLDKDGEPFEVYFNPKIEIFGDSINSGLEGCLSVPGYHGKVDRSHNIEISYIDSMGKKQKENINGFTSVIFQHEIDHLNGILYFDHVYGGYNSLIEAIEN